MKKIFVYKSEIVNSDILICIGVNLKDIKKWADKKGTKEFRQMIKENGLRKFDKAMEKNAGFVHNIVNGKKSFYILWMENFTNRWESFEILLHEIVHFKQFQFINKAVDNEIEFEAYFIESTFRELRRLLFKELKL